MRTLDTRTLKLIVVQWSLIASVTVILVAATVAFGASQQKGLIAKPTTKKVSPPVVSTRDLVNPRLSFSMPLDPQALAEERAAFAPAEALRIQAEAAYQSGDLAGAEAACLQALSAAPVMRGQKQQAPYVDLLLGRIYLKGGQNAKAVSWLQRARAHEGASGLDLDLALACARSGDYANAGRFYSDQDSLQYLSEGAGVLPQDLPGTDSPRTLEASILLARGLDVYFEHRHDDALMEFQAANRLAPENALIAYHCANILSEKGRFAEAAPLYEQAATGRGEIGKEGKLHLGWAKSSLAAAARTKQ